MQPVSLNFDIMRDLKDGLLKAKRETEAVELLQSLGYTVTPPEPAGYDAAIATTSRDLGIPEDQLRAGRDVAPLTPEQKAD